ncbi:MAG: hypothetical protein AB1696_27315 [Planctomycetota bacterium]
MGGYDHLGIRLSVPAGVEAIAPKVALVYDESRLSVWRVTTISGKGDEPGKTPAYASV